MNTELNDALEALIDKHGLTQVLVAIAEVCDAKAEHLAVNWQDADSARYWTQDAGWIGKLAAKVNN